MNKFIINEEEKRRILMKHESAAKKQYLKEQEEDDDNNINRLNNELLDYFQKQIDEIRNNIGIHKPDTIASVMQARANDFLNRSQFEEDFADVEKWGKSKN